jgi:hypothetical protein
MSDVCWISKICGNMPGVESAVMAALQRGHGRRAEHRTPEPSPGTGTSAQCPVPSGAAAWQQAAGWWRLAGTDFQRRAERGARAPVGGGCVVSLSAASSAAPRLSDALCIHLVLYYTSYTVHSTRRRVTRTPRTTVRPCVRRRVAAELCNLQAAQRAVFFCRRHPRACRATRTRRRRRAGGTAALTGRGRGRESASECDLEC